MASLVSIIPTVIADLFMLFERLQMSAGVPFFIDALLVGMNMAWWPVVVLFNYIIWKGKLILGKIKTNEGINKRVYALRRRFIDYSSWCSELRFLFVNQ